ncbi:MAG: phospholipase A [Colwellia sp.]
MTVFSRFQALNYLFFCFLLPSAFANEPVPCDEPASSPVASPSPDNKEHDCKQPEFFHHYELERKNAFDPYIITPHKLTYILPITYTNSVNRAPYFDEGDFDEKLDNKEAKFQVSLKVPLTQASIFNEGDSIAFGFTLTSWWQLYNVELSRPFRETNYQPEIFYTTPLQWQPLGGSTYFVVGFEHQSNGRTQVLSRSWNRLYTTFTFAKDNYAIAFRPWWKIPENKPPTTPDESGDDNPDISDYMGHFELTGAYKYNDIEFSLLGRRNFKESNGFLELGVTFPISGRLKGYVQFSSGYGESMIDYNHSQEKIGLGIAVTEIF